MPNRRGKCDFIDGCAKFNIIAEEFSKFRTDCVAAMREFHSRWHHASTSQLAAYADEYRSGKLHLMPIQMSADAEIGEGDSEIFAFHIVQANAFGGDRAVSRPLLQSLAQRFR